MIKKQKNSVNDVCG